MTKVPGRRCIIGLVLAIAGSPARPAETLGFLQQKFTDMHFEPGKWARSLQGSCYIYTARVDGATVEVLRYGMSNLVPFRARNGLAISVCGSVAAFDEGFEVEKPGGRMTSPGKPSQ